jgi:CRP-like cAMP-binding protein
MKSKRSFIGLFSREGATMIGTKELEDMSLFQRFSASYRQQLVLMTSQQEYQAGDCIFREGQHERRIYIVAEGQVVLEIKVPELGTVQVLRVGHGSLLGWSPILGRGTMTATARALTDCRLIALDAEAVRALAESDPRFGMEFFRTMSTALAERLRATRLQLPDPRMRQTLGLCEGAD